MKTLIKNLTLHYPNTVWDGRKVDVLLEDGIVLEIENQISQTSDQLIEFDGLIGFPSLIDLQATCGEPGNEYLENLNSMSDAAARGGFSHVCLLPTTEPAVDNAAQIRNIAKHNASNGVKLLPYGALSKGCSGKQLSEMFDMQQQGAIGFTDGKSPIYDTNLMKRALEYVKPFGGWISAFPYDESVSPGGMVNESRNNVSLGIKQSPELSEEIMLNRDIYLLEYTGSRLHVSNVSSIGSIDLIRTAKSKGLSITAGVSMHNLIYNESALNDFDTNFKTQPALRSKETQRALLDAVLDGTIDVVVSDHTPVNIEAKDCEFEHAAYGMTMLETMLPLVNEKLDDLKWAGIVQSAALRPRQILGLQAPELSVGSRFDITMFAPNESWIYDLDNCASKSHNSPEFKKELLGRVIRLS